MADALFTINADSSNQGFDATASQVLSLRLKTQPPSGVQSVRFQVWDANAFDPVLDPIRNPPRKAKASPNLTLVGSTSGPNVSPVTIDAAVQVTMPGTTGHAWIVRCVVNGGVSELDDGRVVFDRSLVHERMIVVRDANGARPIVATETTQYEADGWAPEAGRQGPAGADGAPFTPATGSSPGYVSRRAFVNAASTKLDASYFGIVLEAAITLTTPADIPPGARFEVICISTGGSGAGAQGGHDSGQKNGASGPGGPARAIATFSRAELIAALPIVITADLGPTGGVGGASSAGIGIGVSGTVGGVAQFGSLLKAFGGGAGCCANTSSVATGGGGGGAMSAGSTMPFNGSSTAQPGGEPNGGVVNTGGNSGFGGAPSVSGTANNGLNAYTGGASGGNISNTSAGNGARGGDSAVGGGGGAAGGSSPSASNTGNGGDGGLSGAPFNTVRATGGAAAVGASNQTAANGANGADATKFGIPGNPGAGGGAARTTSIGSPANSSATGGNGGNGGFPGGAAGSGGSGWVPTLIAGSGVGTGGNGGKAGDAIVCLTGYA